MQSVAGLVFGAICIGIVFDRLEPGVWRDGAIGFVGAFAILAIAVLSGATPPPPNGSAPVLLVVGLFGGLPATIVALPLTLALHMELDGADGLAAGVLLTSAGLLGAFAHLMHRRLARGIDRTSVLVLSAASPGLLAVRLIEGSPDAWRLAALGLWLALATAGLGLPVLAERFRADALREQNRREASAEDAKGPCADLFETQLRHHWDLHERYGVQFGCLFVALDEAPALRKGLSPPAFADLSAEVTNVARRAVRDCDICLPVSASRTGILLPYIGSAAMGRVAGRIRDGVAATAFTCGRPVSVSVGMAHVCEVNGVSDLEMLAENAIATARVAMAAGVFAPPQVRHDGAEPLVRSFPGVNLPSQKRDAAPATAHACEEHPTLGPRAKEARHTVG